GEPVPISDAPFISQIIVWPLVPLRHRMSAKPSPLKSRWPTIAQGPPCWDHTPPLRVNTHAAPAVLLSLIPPTITVLPSADSATDRPCCAFPTAPVPTSFGPCCLNPASAASGQSSAAERTAVTSGAILRATNRERTAAQKSASGSANNLSRGAAARNLARISRTHSPKLKGNKATAIVGLVRASVAIRPSQPATGPPVMIPCCRATVLQADQEIGMSA